MSRIASFSIKKRFKMKSKKFHTTIIFAIVVGMALNEIIATVFSRKVEQSAYAHDSPVTFDTNHSLDQEGTDCSKLLRKFRADEIEVAKKEGDVHFRRSFVTLSKETLQSFYIATHDKGIDDQRAKIMKEQVYYERKLTDLIAATFNKKKTEGKESIFLDVGTNIGWFSLVAAAHGATKVYSFEPNLQNTIRFCESLSLNGWSSGNLVTPIAKGVGNMEEVRKLYARWGTNPGSFTFKEIEGAKVVGEMKITTLDLFAERHGWFESKPTIGFFKLDVEAFELEAIEGAKKLLSSHMIEMIAMELKPEYPAEKKEKICQILFGAGYKFTMYGDWEGPSKSVNLKHSDCSRFAKDFQANKYGENVIFQL